MSPFLDDCAGRTLLKGDNITIIQLATIEGDGPRR